jgi:hypothetical protein
MTKGEAIKIVETMFQLDKYNETGNMRPETAVAIKRLLREVKGNGKG